MVGLTPVRLYPISPIRTIAKFEQESRILLPKLGQESHSNKSPIWTQSGYHPTSRPARPKIPSILLVSDSSGQGSIDIFDQIQVKSLQMPFSDNFRPARRKVPSIHKWNYKIEFLSPKLLRPMSIFFPQIGCQLLQWRGVWNIFKWTPWSLSGK